MQRRLLLSLYILIDFSQIQMEMFLPILANASSNFYLGV